MISTKQAVTVTLIYVFQFELNLKTGDTSQSPHQILYALLNE